MFTKLERRLIKEGLIRIYRDFPAAARFPVYYLTADSRSPSEVAEIVGGLHDLPAIPWPDDDCILLCEDHLLQLFMEDETEDQRARHLVCLIHFQKEHDLYSRIPKVEEIRTIEPINTVHVFYHPEQKGKVEVRSHPPTYMTRVESPLMKEPDSETLDKQVRSQVNFIKEQTGNKWLRTSAAEDRYIKYMKSCLPRSSHSYWMARTLGAPTRANQGIGFASDILGYLATIAVPCNYVVKSQFQEGFGPTGEMRRATKGKEIFTVIAYDRLYRELVGGEGHHAEKSPHFRRGHIRHFWLESGIDRRFLPASPAERIRIVHEMKVRRTYIPPSWIGGRVFKQEDTIHEIMVEELPLRVLG